MGVSLLPLLSFSWHSVLTSVILPAFTFFVVLSLTKFDIRPAFTPSWLMYWNCVRYNMSRGSKAAVSQFHALRHAYDWAPCITSILPNWICLFSKSAIWVAATLTARTHFRVHFHFWEKGFIHKCPCILMISTFWKCKNTYLEVCKVKPRIGKQANFCYSTSCMTRSAYRSRTSVALDFFSVHRQ